MVWEDMQIRTEIEIEIGVEAGEMSIELNVEAERLIYFIPRLSQNLALRRRS